MFREKTIDASSSGSEDWKIVLQKMARWCAYQERCEKEVKLKLSAFDAGDAVNLKILETLKQQNFYSDERYCRSFVRGKFHHLAWGRVKVKLELRQKEIPVGMIDQVIRDEITPQEYESAISKLIEKKRKTIRGKSDQEIRLKITRYLVQKGFEASATISALKKNQAG